VFKIKLPKIDFRHLKALTDETGIVHHTAFSIPERREGYTTDDNARALIACVKYTEMFNDSGVDKLIGIYLSFLLYMQKNDGRFHNMLSYERKFIEEEESEDSIGRTLMACGYTMNSNVNDDYKTLAKQIFDEALPWAFKFTSPRAKAFTILGLDQYYRAFPKDQNIKRNMKTLGHRLKEQYHNISIKEWKWFEPYLTYENAVLPQAMFTLFDVLRDDTDLSIAEESFNFLVEVQIKNGTFHPIGNRGWYKRGGERAFYDQQPIEAASMVESAVEGFTATDEERYRKIAKIAFDWYLGNNSQGTAVYNTETGVCYDGLTPEGLNRNQGAESIITYLIARLTLEKIG